MLKRNDGLINGRGLGVPAATIDCGAAQIAADNAAFIAALVAQGVQNPSLPPNPPFEINPYQGLLTLQNYEKYIIGTFPPISYVLDNPLILAAGINSLSQPIGAAGDQTYAPAIPFYHGNQGSMWNYLLTPPQQQTLWNLPRAVQAAWLINFLTIHRINYADIINSTQRQLNGDGNYGASDNYYFNICPNIDLICHIISNSNARYLLFNTASISGRTSFHLDQGGNLNISNSNTKSFDLFVRGCQELGFSIKIRIPNGPAVLPWTPLEHLNPLQRTNKLCFEMKIENKSDSLICGCQPGMEKIVTVITGPSPSRQALRSLPRNQVYINWLQQNPGGTPTQFIKFVYSEFTHPVLNPMLLYNLN